MVEESLLTRLKVSDFFTRSVSFKIVLNQTLESMILTFAGIALCHVRCEIAIEGCRTILNS